jgi:hypothetical protein
MTQGNCELFSVAGGKFHRPSDPAVTRPWQPTTTRCGLTVTPLNYFLTAADADRQTGGRLSIFMCATCAKRETPPPNHFADLADALERVGPAAEPAPSGTPLADRIAFYRRLASSE